MADAKQVDLDQQAITVAGIPLQGWADGDVATIEFDGPAWLWKIGADGVGVRSKNLNRSAILKAKLSPASAVNDVLSALHNSDMKASNGAGVGPFLYEDLQGTTLLEGEQCWIEAPPNLTIGAQPGDKEWTIRIANLSGVFGGN